MKHKTFSFLLLITVLLSILPTAFAVSDGYVSFSSAGKLIEQNFNVDQIFDDILPGDTRSYTVYLTNENSRTTRWYMSNEVLKSLENDVASGGAYTYRLEYYNPSGKQSTLFDSSRVGGDQPSGDGRIGLREATAELENYFFLDTLNSNDRGRVVLTVGLEGETQGNTYQNTAARIRMNFAVEPANASPSNSSTSRAVKTGDEHNLLPYYIAMGITGLLFLYLALDAYTDRKFQKGRSKK